MPWSTGLRIIPPKENELEYFYASSHGQRLGLLPGALTLCISGRPPATSAGRTGSRGFGQPSAKEPWCREPEEVRVRAGPGGI